MVDAPKVGVVTVTYNSRRLIDGFMLSLLRQTYSDFIFFDVDNASTDGTLDGVCNYKDARIRVISNQKNLGVAEGNNQGISAALDAGCGSVLLINNDTEFEPSLLEILVQGLREHACDMIAPKILFHDNRKMIWCAGGGFIRSKGQFGAIHYGIGQIDRGQFDVTRRVDHAPTCCLLVRKAAFARIGLMDSRYFVYLDDVDFCFRAMRADLRLFYLPSARLFHKAGSLTGGPDSDFSVRYCTRNYVYFTLKNLGLWRGLYYLPAYQLHLVKDLAFRRIGVARFLLRQRAFVEGVQVWRHTLAQ